MWPFHWTADALALRPHRSRAAFSLRGRSRCAWLRRSLRTLLRLRPFNGSTDAFALRRNRSRAAFRLRCIAAIVTRLLIRSRDARRWATAFSLGWTTATLILERFGRWSIRCLRSATSLSFVSDLEILTLRTIRNRFHSHLSRQFTSERRRNRRRARDHCRVTKLPRDARRNVYLAAAPRRSNSCISQRRQ